MNELMTPELWKKIRTDIAERMLAKAKLLAPVRDGELKSKMYYKIEDDIIHLGSDVSYADYVEFGTGIYHTKEVSEIGVPEAHDVIRPKNAKVLAWTKGPRPASGDSAGWKSAAASGNAFYAKFVKGMHPHPYLRPAVFTTMPEIPDIIQKAIQEFNIPSVFPKHSGGIP